VPEGFVPQDAETCARRGDVLFERGDFQHALLFFTDAARLKPLVPEYAYRVGLAHWRLGFHESARQAFERAILLKADFAHAHGELGRVLLAMERLSRR